MKQIQGIRAGGAIPGDRTAAPATMTSIHGAKRGTK